MSLSEKDSQVIWHPYTQMQSAKPAIGIVRGEGSWLYAEDGKNYLDIAASWWVNIHGHAHPYIAEQISKQLHTLEHVIFAGFTHEPAVLLAEKLLTILPDNQSRVFYSDNGSTAVEVALKMALQYWYNTGKPKKTILALQHAYHGDTFGAMSISERNLFTMPFFDLLFDVKFVDVPVAGKEDEAIKAFEDTLKASDDIAAFIFEPLVQGTGGMIMYSAEALDKMLAIAKAHHVLTIADEVMTGFGRTGKLFAMDYLSNKPDMMCLSKGLTGGTMPLGITTCTKEIFSAFLSEDRSKMLFHGHSYTGNPLACTAGIASFELLMKPECLEAIDRISASHRTFVNEMKGHKALSDIRSLGTILAMELNTGEGTSYFNSQRDRLYDYFLERNILMRPLGNIIYLLPPYSTTEKDLQYVYHTIKEFLSND
jgi:adenosylmethionine-8-amino-7-oxononanoate aminotransferase